ncbi:hypothetical protein K8640_37210 [Myxococcus sp. XM-1-1-1]|uniref:hypothetical protein n=1 Tax=Myxococcus sp. XM-1-1-1 TaxID=2874602 RepID=UPI001CBF3076|nr:hypothetical protein [Myxococcus sp. XM-1-1-1]MBZ4413877.1 hypothetical protein [Myxococcus sp. XM-1-1-1]
MEPRGQVALPGVLGALLRRVPCQPSPTRTAAATTGTNAHGASRHASRTSPLGRSFSSRLTESAARRPLSRTASAWAMPHAS